MNFLAQYRTRSATELIDASVQFYRTHAGVLLVICAAVIFPPAVVRAFAPAAWGAYISLLGNLLVPVAQGAMFLVVAAAINGEEDIDAGQAYSLLGERAGRMIGVQFATGLLLMVGFILFVIPVFFVLAWTSVAGPALVVEDVPVGEALNRSRALTRGHLKLILGTLVLAWVVGFLLLMGAAFVIGAIAGVAGVGSRATDFIGEVIVIPVLPIFSIPSVMLYYDLRVRNEGADIAAMAADLPALHK